MQEPSLPAYIKTVRIQPVINDDSAADFVRYILGVLEAPADADIVASDIRSVGVDLSSVPLDEVLDFRAQYGAEYRSYARDVRKFAFLLPLLTEEDRVRAIQDRSEELAERAHALDSASRKAFRRPALALALGLAGAAWSIINRDPVSAVVGAGTAWATFDIPDMTAGAGVYAYILRAHHELAR
jgi:hypothetical protein